jgi:hypothetical protein
LVRQAETGNNDQLRGVGLFTMATPLIEINVSPQNALPEEQ